MSDKVGPKSVRWTTSWIPMLPWEGIAAAKVKSWYWGDAYKIKKQTGNP